MIFGVVILLTALTLSIVAAFYSITGLVAIFSAMPIPIIVMGGALEIAKIVSTVFLHNNWKRLSILYKVYLVPAVIVLMFLTSIGIFGLLSKAHSDQNLVSGDVQSKIAIYDEKIKTARENINANRKALTQMDAAVDQVMSRSNDEKGADKANAIRRNQQKERTSIQKDIEVQQRLIITLNDQAAPIRAEVRKVEADVGPLKYIAAMIYGDNPSANILEHAVRWVILTIVFVFDPLALVLILSANKQFEWALKGKGGWIHDEDPEPPVTAKLVPKTTIPNVVESPPTQSTEGEKQEAAWLKDEYYDLDEKPKVIEIPKSEGILSAMVDDDKAAMNIVPPEEIPNVTTRPFTAEEIASLNKPVDDVGEGTPDEKAAERAWKTANPNDTLKHQRALLEQGKIQQLPWITVDNKQGSMVGFGTQFPTAPTRGSMYVRIDRMPTALFKFNGLDWIEIDKNLSDEFSYDAAYVEHLIAKVDSGEYDPELLNDAERAQIALHIGKA